MSTFLKDLKRYAGTTIYNRGNRYFKDEAITDWECLAKGVYEASIRGTDHYHVRVEIQKEELVNYSCTCPYNHGPICKHVVAAAIYAHKFGTDDYEVIQLDTTLSNTPVLEQLATLLEQISFDDLKKMITKKASKDKNFRSDIINELKTYALSETTKPSEEIINDNIYREQIMHLIDEVGDKEEYYYEEDRHPIEDRVTSLLDSAQMFLTAKKYIHVIEICVPLAEELSEAYEEEAIVENSVYMALNLLRQINKEDISETLRKYLWEFAYLGLQKEDTLSYWEDDLLPIVGNLTKSEEEFEKVTKILYDSEYSSADLIHYNLIFRLKGKQKAITFLEEHLDNFSLRRLYIEMLIEEKNYQKAKGLLNEALTFETSYTKECYQYLLEIAEVEKDKTGIIFYAQQLFFNTHGYFSVTSEIEGSEAHDYFLLLKKVVSKNDWKQFVDKLTTKLQEQTTIDFSSETQKYLLAVIYIEEKNWKCLFFQVKQNPTFEVLVAYQKYLQKDYAHELSPLYENNILAYLKNNMGRKYYETACKYINKIIELGYSEDAKDLIENLKETYPTRRALKEELNKIRF